MSRSALSALLSLVLPATAFPRGVLQMVMDYYQPLVAVVMCNESVRLYDVFARQWAGYIAAPPGPFRIPLIPEHQLVAVSNGSDVLSVASYLSGELITQVKTFADEICWLSKAQRLVVANGRRIELRDPKQCFECVVKWVVEANVRGLTALKCGQWLAVRFGGGSRIYAMSGSSVQIVHELSGKWCGIPMTLPGDHQMLTFQAGFNANALALWTLPDARSAIPTSTSASSSIAASESAAACGSAAASAPASASVPAPIASNIASDAASKPSVEPAFTLKRVWMGNGFVRPAVCAPGVMGCSPSTLLLCAGFTNSSDAARV
jgi:hypothetical protein